MPPRKRYKPAPRIPRPIMNERIFAQEIFVVGSDGEKLGVMKKEEALAKAREEELDLILVAPKARPPVAKILDFGKWQYEQKKSATKNRSSGKAKAMKGIRLGVRIAEGDLEVRVKRGREFLEKGHKLRVVLQFKGREMVHFDLALEKMKEFASRLDDVGKIEELPKRMGRQLIMIIKSEKSQKLSTPNSENNEDQVK
ncbi:translation initiation factor IF-3 [Patescibacteria group bacterium]|nr:translation initiation factor IF-3 [Patescibacteria group bacterium]